jgi:diguanylate cyclase (GGDEF)-like protein
MELSRLSGQKMAIHWTQSKVSTIGLTAGVITIALIAFLVFGVKGYSSESKDWMQRHLMVYNELQATLEEFRAAENWQQTYIISGNETDLREFKSASERTVNRLFSLRNSNDGDQWYNERFRKLEDQIKVNLQQLRSIADVRGRKGADSARDLLLTTREARESRSIGKEVLDAENDEVKLLQYKVLEMSEIFKYVRIFACIALGVLAFTIVVISRMRSPKLEYLEVHSAELEKEVAKLSSQLERLAHVDYLTDVLNTKGLEDAISVEQNRLSRTGGQLVCALINCDNFRRITDTRGHNVGDLVLKEMAKRISLNLRPSDCIARVGGDEFLVLLTDTQLAYVMRVAERIRKAIADTPLRTAPDPLSITCSMGIATVPTRAMTVDDLVNMTRTALKRAKVGGKNRVALARDGGGVATATRDIVDMLSDGSAFRAVYQPIMDLSTDRISGYEMYSRGPDGAFESPADFFRVCVENDMLTSVDLLCLKHCIGMTSSIRKNLRFHINLFPSTILETPVEDLISLFPVDKAGKVYCIEISEQQFVGDPITLRDKINVLKEAGILVAIDDIGFGRSSLECLILLEPDVVKVDRKYVSGVSKDPAKARLLRRVVNVAKSLGAEIVAEGIEEDADLPVLREIGIHYGQGYFWGELLEVLPEEVMPRPLIQQPERR